MKTCIAILLYTLSLFGIDVGSHIRVDRVRSDGTDVLYSKVVAQPMGTRFECVRSASGQCYYTVFAADCAAAADPVGKPASPCARNAAHFAIADGGSRELAPLTSLRMCVSADAGLAGAQCQ